jgi:S1-C subfamily serine protease
MISIDSLGRLATALEGIPVWGSLPGSVAQRAGMRYGDVIVRVNGEPTPTVDAYLRAQSTRTDGMTVTFVRDGAEHSADLAFASASRPSVDAVAREVVDSRMMPIASSQPESESEPDPEPN